MAYLPKNTLAYLKASPYCEPLHVGLTPLSEIAKTTFAFIDKKGSKRPDTEALEFYALNHLVSIIKKKFTLNEILPEWASEVLELYMKTLADQGPRLMHYVTCIIARESRHINDDFDGAVFKHIKTNFGMAYISLYKKLHSKGEDGAVKTVTSWEDDDITIEGYASALEYGFEHGNWGSGYGGHPWGTIAEALKQLVTGVMSMEAFVDRGYNLAHNGGPMFNKGILYHNHKSQFQMTLDVQRSGQIPELIVHGIAKGVSLYLKPEAKFTDLVKKVMDLFPSEFGQYVDWHKVEAAGSTAKYENEIEVMHNEHPESDPAPKPKVPAVPDNVLLDAVKSLSPVIMPLLGEEFAVFPGQSAKILKRIHKSEIEEDIILEEALHGK